MDLQKLDDSSAASAASRSCNLAQSSPGYQTPSVCNSGLRDVALPFHMLRYFYITSKKEQQIAAIASVREN
jgi:hypothetical protein